MPMVPVHGRAKIGQDVAEQVAPRPPRRNAVADCARSARSGCRRGTCRPARRRSFCAIAATRSSQYGIEIEMPLLLGALVRCSSAQRARFECKRQHTIDAGAREKCLLQTNCARAANMRPPTDEYSPSVFSRTM